MKIISNVLSVLFHPLLMVFYAVLIVLYPFEYGVLNNVQMQWILIGLIFLFSFIMPVLFILIMRMFRIVTSITVDKKEERIYPYAFTSVFYLFIWYMFSSLKIFEGVPAKAFLFGSIAIFLVLLVNFKLKISAHTLAMTAICGLVLRLVYHYNELHQLLLLLLCIFLSGLVASARLYLKAHTWNEITLAAVLGFFLGLLGPVFLKMV